MLILLQDYSLLPITDIEQQINSLLQIYLMIKFLSPSPEDEPATNDFYITSPKKLRGNSESSFFSTRNQRTQSQNNLPALQYQYQHPHRINEIRNQTQKQKQNIILLQARLKALQKQKQKNNKQALWATEKVDFLNTIRMRCQEDEERRQKELLKKQMINAYLKRRASQIKEANRKDKEIVIALLKFKKNEEGEITRKERQLNQAYTSQFKDLMKSRKKLKAQQRKKTEKQLEQQHRIQQIQKVQRSKQNYAIRVNEQLQKRKKTYKILHKLNQDQQNLLSQLKMSETMKLDSFKNLSEAIKKNPENGRLRSRRSVYKDMFKKAIQSIEKIDKGRQLDLYY